MRGPWLKGKTERFGFFSWKEGHASEDVKCLRLYKNLPQGRIEEAILCVMDV